jgi:cell division protein FtsL
MSTISEKRPIDYRDMERYYRMKEETMLNSKKKKCQAPTSFIQIKYFLYVAIIFVLSLGMIFNYATITQRKMEINDLKKDITLIEKQKEDIIIALETIKNSNIIEENAMNFLGMDYALSTQNHFLSISYETNTEDEFTYTKKQDKNELLNGIIERTFLIFAKEGI